MATKKAPRSTSGRKAAPKAKKGQITEDDIRKRAEEIYLERIARGDYRPAEEDWLQAERELREQ